MSAEDSHPAHLDLQTVDYSKVAKVATRSKPVDVLLFSCEARLTVSTADVPADWHEKAYIAYDTHTRAGPREAERFATHAAFLALYFPGLDPKVDPIPSPDDDDDRSPAVLIDAAFELSYSLESTDGIDDDDLDHFAFVNSTLHAWPYWREFAHSMSTRMGLSPLVVAPFKLPSPYDPEEEDDDVSALGDNDA